MNEVETNPTWILVVAAVISQDDGRLLMQKRPDGKHHAGLWEFPGGKVEKGESPENALVREIEEELGLVIDPTEIHPESFAQTAAHAGRPQIVLLLYKVAYWTGEPEAREGGDWGWFNFTEANELPKPPLDIELFKSFPL